MSSYGIEVEIWCPVYFEISSITIQDLLTKEFIPVEFNRSFIKIGPERISETAALYDILKLVFSELEKRQKVFEKLREAASNLENFGTLRLNRSPINLDSVETAATIFNFPVLSTEETKFVLKNIIFSTDHDIDSQMILELVSNPIGRYKHHDKHVFEEQEKFLACFFKFCHALANSYKEYKFHCSIDWHDARRWNMLDTKGNRWNYAVFFQGTFTFSESRQTGKLSGGRFQITPANRFPQYNFSVDLSHFTLAGGFVPESDLKILIAKKRDFFLRSLWRIPEVQIELSRTDPLFYLYSVCALDHDLIGYHLFLTELSRHCVHRMSVRVNTITTTYTDSKRTTILGAFGYTILYFLSLCMGGVEGNRLHKNLFLLMPKTSPIHFLKAAYDTDPAYYHMLMLNMTTSFCEVLFCYFQIISNVSTKFGYYLNMDYVFPRLARWYRTGQDDIELATPSMEMDSTLRSYSNPLSPELSPEVHELHKLVLDFGGQSFDTSLDPFLHGDVKKKCVLLVLLKFLNLIFIGGSDECKKIIRLQGDDTQKTGLRILGKILTAQDANQIPVYAQPGFGRPKLEARGSRFMPTEPKPVADLVSALNSIGRPAVAITPVFSETIKLPENIDQISIDLTLSNMGAGDEFQSNDDDPWESNEYKYVWIPGAKEFGRRKDEDIRRWLASLDSRASAMSALPAHGFDKMQDKVAAESTAHTPDAPLMDIVQISRLLSVPDKYLDMLVRDLI